MLQIVTGENDGKISAEDAEKYKIKDTPSTDKGIPDYWKLVILTCDFFDVNKNDEKVLDHLRNVTLDFADDSLDFFIHFHFDKNEFFDHEIISKQFIYNREYGEPEKAMSTEIQWKEGKNPAIKVKTKKSRCKPRKIKP